MLLKIVKAGRNPEEDVTIEELWSCGTEADESDVSGLSSSVLSAIMTNFDVGSWYSMSDFRRMFSDADWQNADLKGWTAIQIVHHDVKSKEKISLEVDHLFATRLICESIIQLFDYSLDSKLWIRAE